jgi:hypothetical protein
VNILKAKGPAINEDFIVKGQEVYRFKQKTAGYRSVETFREFSAAVNMDDKVAIDRLRDHQSVVLVEKGQLGVVDAEIDPGHWIMRLKGYDGTYIIFSAEPVSNIVERVESK